MEVLEQKATKNDLAIAKLDRVFKLQNAAFLRTPYPSLQERKELMERVKPMLVKFRERILGALEKDFGGHSHEQGDLLEIVGMFDRAKYNIANVGEWMKPVKKEGNPVIQGSSKIFIKHEPKGVIGNMVSWNFPFDIAIGPMLDQLAAGNRIIIKPSDLAPECGAVLEEMIADTFNEDRVAVVNGGLELAKYFPTLAWNHLVYTGSGSVGKLIMKAAAENLVPVTLELGGKSPVIVSVDAINDETIKSIAGVKAIKRGQMCVTADYCLVPEEKLEDFTEKISKYMTTAFAHDNGRAHACGIISKRHLRRLQSLVEEARAAGSEVIQIGDNVTGDNRDMPFYIVVNPSDELALMQEEIFGPILPIKTYRSTEDIIDFVNKGGSPLGLYIYANNQGFIDKITQSTRSGGVAVNAMALQAAQPSMAFGGVGASGMGVHHGQEAFKEFTNPRGYFIKGKGGTIDWIIPPYTDETRKLINGVAYGSMVKQLKFALSRLPNILFKKD